MQKEASVIPFFCVILPEISFSGVILVILGDPIRDNAEALYGKEEALKGEEEALEFYRIHQKVAGRH